MANEKIRVFVVDYSDIWRRILINHLSTCEDIEIVGEMNNAHGSILMLDEVNPDVVLLDVSVHERMSPSEIIAQMLAIKPSLRVIICADSTRADMVMDAVDKGAVDFITKPYKRQLIVRAVYESVRRSVET